uniref:DSHCT domain-containing protein n=1 Tax=Mesocestoides corti TaxID=53468 RepID=A0A5K3EHR5_MESCO
MLSVPAVFMSPECTCQMLHFYTIHSFSAIVERTNFPEGHLLQAFKRLLELLGQTCSASHPAGDDILTSGMKDVHDTIRQGVLCTPSLYVADHDRLITQAVVHVVCCRRQR